MADDAEAIIAKHSPEVRALIERVRTFIREMDAREMDATLTENAYPGWGTLMYGRGRGTRDATLAIDPQRSYVNLAFGRGSELADPHHLLEGTGKRMRHVKIRHLEDLERPELRELVEAAVRA